MKRMYKKVLSLERWISDLYGLDSMAMRALDLVIREMNTEKCYSRDDGSDYYTHCVEVANTLISFGIKDQDIICAALLHDIIEDVDGYNEAKIRELFNENVSRMVMLLTKKQDFDKHKEDDVREYIAGIKTDARACVIKAADRMHNMMTLDNKTLEACYNKAMETETYYLPFFEECSQMYTRYSYLFNATIDQINSLIHMIVKFYREVCIRDEIIKSHNPVQ